MFGYHPARSGPPMRLLLVDDDSKLRRFVQSGLRECGFECETAANAEEARALITRPESFDLVLLDVLMPGQDGWQFIEELRRGGDQTPVIFLTAAAGVDERVRGLRLGADDYVSKPFELRELLARIEAVLRRRDILPPLVVGDLRLDRAHRVLERGGQRIDTSPREFEVLQALFEARGEVLSRGELLRNVWGIEFDPETNVVEVAIARLRKRLGNEGRTRIETVSEKGYRLKAGEPQ